MFGNYLIPLGLKNKAPQFSFKNSAAEDFISLSSHEFSDKQCYDLLDILDAKLDYGVHAFAFHGPMPLILSYIVTCTFPHNVNEI